MLSKEMYLLLNRIPRYNKRILYLELNCDNNEEIDNLLCEAQYQSYDYIIQHGNLLKQSSFSLTEKGQAAIEEYEQAERNEAIIKKSLNVSRAAMWAAIASAAVAIASLIKLFL